MGFYYGTEVNAASMLHVPITGAFHLYVFRADSGQTSVVRTLQVCTSAGIPDAYKAIFYRKHSESGWSKWFKLVVEDDHQLKTYTYLSQLEISTPVTTAEICDKLTNGNMFAAGVTAKTVTDVPDYYTNLVIIKNDVARVTCFATQALGEGLWYAIYRVADGNTIWSGWKQIATAEPPTEYDLPLASGFAPYVSSGGISWPCAYSKDQFNRVHLSARLHTQVALGQGNLLATLPAGFRPQKTISTACRLTYYGESTPIISQIDIQTNGMIKVFTQSHAATSGNSSIIVPPCSFLAAS